MFLDNTELRQAGDAGADRYRWGPQELNLDPATTYDLRVEIGAPLGAETFMIRFTTGSDASTPDPLSIGGVSATVVTDPPGAQPTGLLGLSNACSWIVGSQDCYDTGPYARLRFDTDVDVPFWIVDGHLWPTQCEGPGFVTHAQSFPPSFSSCHTLQAMDAAGHEVAVTEHCITSETDTGCQTASPPLLWGLLALILLRLRHARRRRPA